jgi:hypothetical protein
LDDCKGIVKRIRDEDDNPLRRGDDDDTDGTDDVVEEVDDDTCGTDDVVEEVEDDTDDVVDDEEEAVEGTGLEDDEVVGRIFVRCGGCLSPVVLEEY